MFLGKTICSMINEARLAALGGKVDDLFGPSVPFAATASAGPVVAELIKALMFPERTYPQTLTAGNLSGIRSAAVLNRLAARTCECVAQRGVIERLRARRAAAGSRD
jgi:hypothetical protein